MTEVLRPAEQINIQEGLENPEAQKALESVISLLKQQIKPKNPKTYIRKDSPNKAINEAIQKLLQHVSGAPKMIKNSKGETVDWADSHLGKNTEKYVKILQSQLGVNPDGVVGEKTLEKLSGLQERSETLISSHGEQEELASLVDPEETEPKPETLKLPKNVPKPTFRPTGKPKNTKVKKTKVKASVKKNNFEGLTSEFINEDGMINSSKPTINQILPNKDSAYVIDGKDGRTTTVLWNGKDFVAIGDMAETRFRIYEGDKILSPVDYNSAVAAHKEKLGSNFPAVDIPLNKLGPAYRRSGLTPRQREVAKIYKKKKNSPLARKVRSYFARFGEKTAEEAVLVSVSESNCKNINDRRNNNGSCDYGPIQVNTVHLKPGGIAYRMGVKTKAQLRNPDISLKVAAALYAERGWQPWYGARVVGL